MTWIVTQRRVALYLLALLALGLQSYEVSAATAVVRNSGPVPAQIGFDGAPPATITPRSTARFSLNEGDHSSQCRFEGIYDGCNLEERFVIAGTKDLIINLRPVVALQRAVTLAQQGMLSVETGRDSVWATNTLDVPGTAGDCAGYESGRLGAVSTRVRSGMAIGNVTLATLNVCGEQRPVVGTVINGAQVYVPLRFVTFRDREGRPILVRQ